jgi:hypothetical protein
MPDSACERQLADDVMQCAGGIYAGFSWHKTSLVQTEIDVSQYSNGRPLSLSHFLSRLVMGCFLKIF